MRGVRVCCAFVLCLSLTAPGLVVARDSLVLLVQPPAWREAGRVFDPAPLAALLAGALGQPVRVRLSDDTLSHWHAVREPDGYQLAFDEAHFAAYRVSRHGFQVLARAAGEVRFALVASATTLIAAPSDLVARRVAVPAPPALAALRLLELFPDAVQVPELITLPSREAALAALTSGLVAGAVLALDGGYTPDAARIALFTDASPGRALSIARALDEATRTALLRMLIDAHRSRAGRRALAGVWVQSMEPASDVLYEDSERLLRGTWGY